MKYTFTSPSKPQQKPLSTPILDLLQSQLSAGSKIMQINQFLAEINHFNWRTDQITPFWFCECRVQHIFWLECSYWLNMKWIIVGIHALNLQLYNNYRLKSLDIPKIQGRREAKSSTLWNTKRFLCTDECEKFESARQNPVLKLVSSIMHQELMIASLPITCGVVTDL